MPDPTVAAMTNDPALPRSVEAPVSSARCPVCSSAETTLALVKLGFRYERCRQCGTVFVHPMPSVEAVHAHYQEPSYFAGDEGQGYRNYAAMHKTLAPHFHRRLQALKRHLGRSGRLLDFGCADGFFLELARAGGWDIAGVEVAQEMAHQTGQRLQAPIVKDLDALPKGRLFDAITMWEVIEHLPDPVAELKRLRQLLCPSGVLMLSTPNANHWQAMQEADLWPGFRPPSHLVLFTEEAVTMALKQAGFGEIRIHRTAPLPPLPRLVRQATGPLQRALSSGQARPWLVALAAWRAVRLLGLGWHRLASRHTDIFATLEVIALCPA